MVTLFLVCCQKFSLTVSHSWASFSHLIFEAKANNEKLLNYSLIGKVVSEAKIEKWFCSRQMRLKIPLASSPVPCLESYTV